MYQEESRTTKNILATILITQIIMVIAIIVLAKLALFMIYLAIESPTMDVIDVHEMIEGASYFMVAYETTVTYIGITVSTILAILSTLTSHAQRHTRAHKLGIPPRQTYEPSRSGLETIIDVTIPPIIAVTVPLWIIRSEMGIPLTLTFTILGMFIGWIMLREWIGKKWKYSKGKLQTVSVVVIALILLGNILFQVPCILLEIAGLTTIIVMMLAYMVVYMKWLADKLVEYNFVESTCQIDGKKYLVAMRHNPTHWILTPCKVTVIENERRIKKTRITCQHGKYIISDLQSVKLFESHDNVYMESKKNCIHTCREGEDGCNKKKK